MNEGIGLKDFNRVKVKERLLRTAADIWGYQPSQMEGFDPIVDLLFGACSLEFEKISHEINDSQTRSLEKLADLMIPQVQALPHPSHIILYAQPAEPNYQLTQTDQFYYQKEFSDKENPMNTGKKTVYFSPINAATIFDGSVKYLAKGDTIYKYENPLTKSRLAKSKPNMHLDSREIWLGIELSDRINSLKGLCFYFNWKTSTEKSNYKNNLSHSRWFVADKELRIVRGIKSALSKEAGDGINMQLNENVNETFENRTMRFYNDVFITIENNLEDFHKNLETFPEAFSDVFEKPSLDLIDKEVLWVKVTFPQSTGNDFVQNGIFAINCFPAINRRLHSNGRPFSLEKEINSIPLDTEDYFLSIKKVHNKEGKEYRQVNLDGSKNSSSDTYSLRSSAVGRFDERNATTILNHIIELMRDESVAFKAWDDRLLSADIKEATQVIARLEQAVLGKTKTKDLLYYLLIEPQVPEDVWIEFWSTMGTFGNNIPTGTVFSCDLLDFKKGTIRSLNLSSSGRGSLTSAEKVHAFKSVLLSRSRYITTEDFKTACFAELGNELKKVDIKSGVMNGQGPNNGFVRTTDIYLTLSDGVELNKDESWNYCHQLKVNLEMKTVDLYQIRVFINDY